MRQGILVFFILLFSFSSLFGQTNPGFEDFEKNYKFHSGNEFIKIMENSTISYTLDPNAERKYNPTYFTLNSPTGQSAPSPYDRRIVGHDGLPKVIEDLPKGDIKKLFDEAEPFMEKKDWEAARNLYQKAAQIDPGYFKTWSNIALTYLRAGNPLQAIGFFKKSISLNPIAWNEYALLSLAFLQLGDKENALDAIVPALIYNRNNQGIIESAKIVLNANNRKLNDIHMSFPFHIEKISEKKCDIYMIGDGSMEWLSMAVSTAVWMMEPEFKEIDRKYAEAGIFNSIKFYEIFYTQFGEIAIAIKDKKTITPRAKLFYDIIKDGYILQVISWDILGQAFPQIIYLMKEEEIIKLKEYIKKYVFVPME